MAKTYNTAFILTFITQFFFGYALFYISNYGVTLLDVNVIFCFILFWISIIFLRKHLEIAVNYPNVIYLAFNIFILISIINPLFNGKEQEIVQNLKSLTHYYFVSSFLLLIFLDFITPKTYYKIVNILILIVIILNLYGIYQLFARAFDLPLAWVTYTNRGLLSRFEVVGEVYQASTAYGAFYRATSIFTEPSALASWNVYLFLFLAIPWIQYRQGFVKSNRLLLFLVIINLITLFLTYSLTGLAGFVAILIFITLIERYQSYKFLFSIAIIAIITIFLTNLLLAETLNIDLLKLFSFRVENVLTLGRDEMAGESFSGRLANAIATIKVWQTNPFIGVGLGLTGYQKEFVALFSDSAVLSILAEGGIFNFLIFNALLYSLFFSSLKLYKKLRDDQTIPLDERKLIGIAPYITLFEIIRCTFTANILIYFVLWMNFSFAFFVLNYYRKHLSYHTLVILPMATK